MVRVEKGIITQEKEELKENNMGGKGGMCLGVEF
jgi:hypothetical protein